MTFCRYVLQASICTVPAVFLCLKSSRTKSGPIFFQRFDNSLQYNYSFTCEVQYLCAICVRSVWAYSVSQGKKSRYSVNRNNRIQHHQWFGVFLIYIIHLILSLIKLLASFSNYEEACNILCGNGRGRTQDLTYQGRAL